MHALMAGRGGEDKSGSGSGLKPAGGGGMGRGGHSFLNRYRPRHHTSRGDGGRGPGHGDTQPMQACDGECGHGDGCGGRSE
jgi:hypothetical protein